MKSQNTNVFNANLDELMNDLNRNSSEIYKKSNFSEKIRDLYT